MKKNKNNELPLTDISIYVTALCKMYSPAHSSEDATHWFTTEEVIEAIKEIDPSAKVNSMQVFKALCDAGFEICNRPGSHGISFRWMFREI